MIRICLAAVAAFAASACASAPQVYTFDNSRTYEASFDATWEAVIDFFASNNIPIQTVERDSGIVYAERQYAGPNSDVFAANADCDNGIGNVQTSSARFNVFVRRQGEGQTQVTVNTTYGQTIIAFMSYVPSAVPCRSTGRLETLILDDIERSVRAGGAGFGTPIHTG